MKKILSLALLEGTVLFAASCSKELVSPVSEEGGEKLSISVSLPDNSTKTDVQKSGSIYKLLWSMGDCVVLNGTVSSSVSEEEAGQQKANFEFEGSFTAPYNLTYCGQEGSDDVVVFPSIQYYSADRCIDENATPMYASASTVGDLTLQHLNSILKFTFTGSQDLANIVVRSRGGERLSGDFKIGKTDGLLNGQLTGGKSDCVTLDCHGFNLDSANEFYVSIPAGTYSEGFDIYVVTTDSSDNVMKLKYNSESECTMVAGRVYEFAEKEFSANSDEFIIATSADFLLFATLGGIANVGVHALVVDDIDMTGEEYSPWKGKMHDGVERTSTFDYYGVLDGCNHEIKGLTSPVMSTLYGQVKNITVEANFDYDGNFGQNYGIGIIAHYAKMSTEETAIDPLIDNVTTNGSVNYVDDDEPLTHAMIVGGLLGASNGVPVTNCTNNASVTVDKNVSFVKSRMTDKNKTECMMCVGGVAGKLQTSSSAKLENCRNTGEISYSGYSKARTFIGGVAGHHSSTGGSIRNCVNDGNVTVTSDAKLDSLSYIGGAIGTAICKTENNANNGKVTYQGTSKANLWIGGVVGTSTLAEASTTYYGDVIGYRNTGDIIAAGTCNTLKLGGIVGAVGNYDKKLLNTTSSGNIEISTACTGTAVAGGVAGSMDPHTCTNNHSYGNIELKSGLSCQYFFVGGLFGTTGSNSTTILDCSTGEGTTIKANGCKFTESTGFGLGGLVGKCGNFNVFRNSENNSDLVISNIKNAGTAGRYDIGGIVGYIQIMASNGNKNGQMKFEQTVNNGNISFPDSPKTASYVRCGGIVGNTAAERQVSGSYTFDETMTVTECVNNGDITFDDITGSKNFEVGGLVGQDQFTKYYENSCVNNGDITLNGSNIEGNALANMNLGGHVGFIYRKRHTEAYITGPEGTAANTGNITLNSNKTLPVEPSAGGIVGAAVGENLSLTAGIANNLILDIKNCINNGKIESTLTNWTPITADYQNYMYSCYCGGIISRITGPWTAGSTTVYTAIDLTIENCDNNAVLAWGKKSPDFTDKEPWTKAYSSSFTGGIIGCAGPAANAANTPIEIKCCHNTGDILSYDGCCGGIAGYIDKYTYILGTPENYCSNSGNIMWGGHKTPQGYAGGLAGWSYTASTQIIKYFTNTGKVYANAGVGGLFGYMSCNAKSTIEYIKIHCDVQSSTGTGNSGQICGNFSKYAWLDGFWLPGMKHIAYGGKLNAKNSAATTFVPQETDETKADYFLRLFGAYKNNDKEDFRCDPETKKASETVKATQYAIIKEHMTPAEKDCHVWDGVSPTSWEK